MASYPPMVLTDYGNTLFGKVQAGATLTFTRFQIGNGLFAASASLSVALTAGTSYTTLPVSALSGAIAAGSTLVIGSGSTAQTVITSAQAATGATSVSVAAWTPSTSYTAGTTLSVTQNLVSLAALLDPITYFEISSISASNGTANLYGLVQNTNFTTQTYTCEIGLLAQDPQAGEILYAYSNAGETAGDTYPPYADGPYSAQYQISTSVAGATSVTANVPSTAYVSVSELGAANGVATLDANGNVPLSQLGNAGAVVSVQEVEITGTTAQQIFSFTPTAYGPFELKLYLRATASTAGVTVTLAYDDVGGAQTYTPAALDDATVEAGSHSVVSFFFGATTAAAITLSVTAGTANQLFVDSAVLVKY